MLNLTSNTWCTAVQGFESLQGDGLQQVVIVKLDWQTYKKADYGTTLLPISEQGQNVLVDGLLPVVAGVDRVDARVGEVGEPLGLAHRANGLVGVVRTQRRRRHRLDVDHFSAGKKSKGVSQKSKSISVFMKSTDRRRLFLKVNTLPQSSQKVKMAKNKTFSSIDSKLWPSTGKCEVSVRLTSLS